MSKILTPAVEDEIFRQGKNVASRYICEGPVFDNNEIISTKPFIIKTDKGNLYITNKSNDTIPNECDYALLNSRFPTKKDFKIDKWNFTHWLKHPLLSTVAAPDIVKSWSSKFNYVTEDTETGMLGLRPPQIAAVHSIMSHVHNADDKGIVVMPTGTGKTETMISVLVANKCKRVLVAVPSDSLRLQISNSFKQL